MDKPLNQLNAFFKFAEERMLVGSDQLLYLHLFNLFNKSHWQETIRITDNELMSAMRLYDSTGKPANVNTIRSAKSRLKLKGFIDFEPGKGNIPTEYKLIQLCPPCDTPNPSPCDTPKDTPCDSFRFTSYTLSSKEDVKTKDTRERENAGAREKVGGNFESKKILRGGQLNLPSAEILKKWDAIKGAKLGGDQLLDLANLENAFDSEIVKKAMESASLRNNYSNYPEVWYLFFKRELEKMLKEGEKNGSDSINVSTAQYAGVDEFE